MAKQPSATRHHVTTPFRQEGEPHHPDIIRADALVTEALEIALAEPESGENAKDIGHIYLMQGVVWMVMGECVTLPRATAG